MNKVLDKLDHMEKSLNTKYNVLINMTAFIGVVLVFTSILVFL